LLEVLDVVRVSEVMHCVLLCMLEGVEAGLCLLNAFEVPEVICCTLYAGGRGG